MKQKRIRLSDQVRLAVGTASMSRYAICKAIGMDQSVMSRFMAGKGGLSMEVLDALAEVLNLELRPASKRARKNK